MFSNNLNKLFKKFVIIIINKLLLKIKNFEKNHNIKDIDIKEFRRINSENILLDKKKYNKVNNPIISIILTVYNQFHCIHKSIRSIQNQSIKNLEIIIIDDCSSDNSTEIIKKYQKEDNRIIIIEHKTNKGKIKSRTDGIKKAKGKYITILDGDDALIHKDVLKNNLYISSLGNLDVVEFKMMIFMEGKLKYCCNQYPIETNNIIYQPELRKKFILLSNDYSIRAIQNRSICAKIIKNKIFKEVLKLVGPKYTEDYILEYEDTIFTVALFQISNSYYYFKEEGYYYSQDDKKEIICTKINNCKPNEKVIKGIDPIKFLQFLIEKTWNNKFERRLVYHEIMSINYYWNFYYNINHHYQMVYKILDKMIQSEFLLKRQKKTLILIKNALKKKENNLLKISIKIII